MLTFDAAYPYRMAAHAARKSVLGKRMILFVFIYKILKSIVKAVIYERALSKKKTKNVQTCLTNASIPSSIYRR